MKHPCQVFVEHELGAVSETQLIEWACEVLCCDGPLAADLTVAKLAGLHPQVQSDLELAGAYFRCIIQSHFPEFTFRSPDGIQWAREALRRRCDDYIQRRITPYEFCRVVSPVEEHFDYPSWLGNLYNACDWIDGHTKREDVPYLADEARRVHEAAS